MFRRGFIGAFLASILPTRTSTNAMAQSQPQNRDDFKRVADPEEYNQQARLKAINDARQRVEDTIEQSMVRMLTDAEFDESDRRQIVRATMFTYLSNVYWVMVEAAQEDGQTADLVASRDFGEVVIEPPAEFERIAQSRDRGYPRIIGAANLEPATHAIEGVKGYLEAPTEFEGSWTLQIERRHESPEPVTRTRIAYMPVSISQNVFGAVNEFLNRAGVDIELDSGKPHGAI